MGCRVLPRRNPQICCRIRFGRACSPQGSTTYEVTEVIAVEDRAGDLPYLLAGLRLGRLADPVCRSDALRRIDRIRRHHER